jgi:hypothetical protein
MSNIVIFKRISFVHSCIMLGIFSSVFVAEITREQKLIFREFYKTTSFYILLFSLFVEVIKYIVIDIFIRTNNDALVGLNNEISRLATENEKLIKLIEEAAQSGLNNNSLSTNEAASLEEITIYAKKKIIAAASDRYAELLRNGDYGELSTLDDILGRIL